MEDQSLLSQLIEVGLPLLATAAVAVLAWGLRKVKQSVDASETKVDDKIYYETRKVLREALEKTKETVE